MTVPSGKKPSSFLFLLGILLVTSLGYAERQRDLEERVRVLASQLRCPVCQNLSVADSPSELAVQMRQIIRERIERGENEEVIRDYFVSKYGEWVLLSPRPRGVNLIVWTLPFLASVAGIGWAYVGLRHWVRRKEMPFSSEPIEPRVLEWLYGDTRTEPKKREGSALEKERECLLETLEELEFDFRSGKLSESDYEETKRFHENRASALFSTLADTREPTLLPRKRRVIAQKRTGAERTVKRSWLIPAGGIFLMVFGVVLGLLLARSIQPRGEQGSITGGMLTGSQGGSARLNPGGEITSDPTSLIRFGREAYHRQQYAEAIDAFSKALSLAPNQPEALSYMGLLMAQTGHSDLGLSYVDRALAAQPQYALALEIKGAILHKGKDDHEGAIRVWEELLQSPYLSKEAAGVITQRIVEARAAMQKTRGGGQ